MIKEMFETKLDSDILRRMMINRFESLIPGWNQIKQSNIKLYQFALDEKEKDTKEHRI